MDDYCHTRQLVKPIQALNVLKGSLMIRLRISILLQQFWRDLPYDKSSFP
jgi:hypothetical protein